MEVVRNGKVPVDQEQVQQKLNECLNNFNKVPENRFDGHPENWDYQPALYTGFCRKDKLYAYKVQILWELKPNLLLLLLLLLSASSR